MKKSKLYLLALLFILSFIIVDVSAQVGINSNNVKASGSAMLEINSTDKGLLIPRISTAARNLIPSPATGLLIYNITTNHFNYYNGNLWFQIESSFVSAITGTNSPGGGVSVSASLEKVADSSAILDVSDPIRGFLPARTNPGAIAAPDNGLIIYDTDANLLKYFFDNVWYPVCAVSTGAPGATGSQGAVGVAINTTGANPHQSAMLDVTAPDKGVLIPRFTNSERDAVLPVPGLMIFNTSSKAIEFFNGTEWLSMNLVLQAGVSISANGQSVCAGTEVTFSADPVNGGGTPQYQWKVNGTGVPGATNALYSYIPSHNDVVSCEMTSSSLCAIGNPATSNLVTMIVKPLLPVSIAVVPSANPVCTGTSVTYNTNIANGGETPSYQWKLNGTNLPGATNTTYSYIPANNDALSCVLVSTATCATGTPASSNTVNMIVNPLLPVSLTIAPSENPVCAGTSVTYTTTPVNSGPGPGYQWKLNGVNVSGATASTYTFAPANNNTVSCVLASNATCATGTPATSNTLTMTVNPILPVGISVAPSANPVCAGTVVTYTSIPTNSGPGPSYQWKLNGTNISGATNSTYSFMPANGNAVSCVLTSAATCATGSPATSNVVNMVVNPLLPVSISINPSANPVCAGTTVTYNTNITNGGPTPVYQWKKNGINISGATNSGYSFIPLHNDAISCVLASNATCAVGTPAASNVVTMTVNPLLPVSLTISRSANPVCAGTTVTYSSAIVNGGPAPAYQWKKNGINIAGATNSAYSYIPIHLDAVSCVLTSNATCAVGTPATSNVLTMTVNPLLPVSITVSPSANPVCAGTTVTYSSGIVNGGPSPQYQWKKNGINITGATNSNYSFVPVHNDALSCVLTSNATCAVGTPAASNVVTMTVNPLLPVSIAVSPSANPVCAGTSVTYSTNIVNGGPSPQYQWKKNGININGATNSAYTFIPLHNDALSCVLTSNATCATGTPATSNVVNMTVNPLLPVSITVSPSANPVCAGTSVTYASAIVNGGPLPLYQWKLNGGDIAGATNSSYTFNPVHNDVLACVLTSNATCAIGTPATSNSVTMTVNPLLPVSISVSPSANPVCAGTSVTYSSAIVNGGLSPLYQWTLDGANISGATNASYTFVPAHSNALACILTSNATCAVGTPATSNEVNMTVHPLLPVSISIAESANPVCAGTQVTYNSTIINGGPDPIYQWKKNGVNIAGATNTSYSFIPLHNDAISCVLVSNATCATGTPATSNVLTMTVNPLLPVSITVSPSANPVCAGTSVTFSTAIVNGGPSPLYQWNLNGTDITGATDATYTINPVHSDALSCMITSNATCAITNPATSNVVTMTVNPLLPVSISVASSANPVCAGTVVTFTSAIVNGGATPLYQWKLNGTDIGGATGSAYTYVPVNTDALSCVLTSNAICATGTPATSNVEAMTVHPLLPVSIAITESLNTICAGTSVTFNSTIVNGGTPPVYQWKLNGTDIAGATNASHTYNPVNTDVVSCMLTSNATCAIGTPAISNDITMIVNPLLPVSITIAPSANPVCAGTEVTFTPSIVNGGPSPLYQWKLNGVNVPGATNATYTMIPVHNNVISCVLTSNATCAIGTPATSNSVTMTVNPLLPVSISITASVNPVCATFSVTFIATTVNGGLVRQFQWKKNGTNITGATNASYTYVPVNNDAISCVLTSSVICPTGNPATSNTITMTVIPQVPVSATIVASIYAMMPGTPVTFNGSAVNQGTAPLYQWKVNGVSAIGATNTTFTYSPANLDLVTMVVTSNSTATCLSNNPATSNAEAMIVYVTGTPCTGVPTVTHLGVTYNTVQIGTQCWLRESMNSGTRIANTADQLNNSVLEKYCYNNLEANCNIYGGLYQWAEAVQYLNGAGNNTNWNPVPAGPVQGICPTGWHIPTNAEWGTLMTSQGGLTVAGGKLKEASLNHFQNPNTGATNSSGFTALPGGQRWTDGTSNYLNKSSAHWTITAGASPLTDVYYGGASYSTNAATNGQFYKATGVSVRCLKN